MKWIVLVKFILDLISQLPLDQRNEDQVLVVVKTLVAGDGTGVTAQGWADVDWAAIIKQVFELLRLLKPITSPDASI